MAELAFRIRRERALWRAARARRRAACILALLILLACGLLAAWRLGLPWAPAAAFCISAAAGACAAAFLIWLAAALLVDLALCPRGRRVR